MSSRGKSLSRERLLIACSGGPDSIALLDMADRWRRWTGAFVAVGHVDHGLRGRSSQRDWAFVRSECARRSIPCGVQRVSVRARAEHRGRGLEDAARELRYKALARLARRFRCPEVATAHTLDDQVETVFLNLIRGTGPAGLTGMAESGPWPVPDTTGAPRLVRPLLNVPKKEILRYLKIRKLSFRTDPTNALPLFLRNRLRPVLRFWDTLRPGFFRRVAQTARLLRDEEDFWRNRLAGGGPRKPGSSNRPRDRGRSTQKVGIPFPRHKPLGRLERAPFLRYHVAEQRRRLRHLYGLTRCDVLERVRLFVSDRARGPLDVPGGRVFKTGGFLTFHRRR